MASGSSSNQGSRAPAGAPPAANGSHLPHQPSLNHEFVAMPATELLAYLERHGRTSDFADATRVLAERERRLRETEELVRQLQAENHTLKQHSMAVDAKTGQLQQPRAANATARTWRGSGASRRPQQVVAARGEVGDVVPTKKRPYKACMMRASLTYPTSSEESMDDDTTSAEGEVGHDVPRHKSLRMNASSGFGGRSALQAKQPRRRS